MKSNVSKLVITFFPFVLANTCYFSDDNEKGYTAKSPYKSCNARMLGYSTCCDIADGDRCLDNGLCLHPDENGTEYMYRGGCKNKYWYDCPDLCLEIKESLLEIRKCGNDNEEYCCQSRMGTNCCDDAARVSVKDIPHVHRPKPPIGAIMGGIIAGGILITGLLALTWWMIRRRRALSRERSNRNSQMGETSSGKRDAHTTVVNPLLAEADAGPQSVLVEADARAVQSRTLHELQG